MTSIRPVIRSVLRSAVRSALEDKFGGSDWWYPGAAADLDFVNQRYYWNGAQRAQSEFDTWTGVTIAPSEGLTTAAAAGVSLAASKFWTGNSGTMIASYRGISVPATSTPFLELRGNTVNDIVAFQTVTTPWFRHTVRVNDVAQARFDMAHNTGVIHRAAMRFDTNDYRLIYDGVLQTADTSGTLVSPINNLYAGKPDTYLRRAILTTSVFNDAALSAAHTWLLANG